MPIEADTPETANRAAVTAAVTTSFAFGWQMARLYSGPLSSAAEPKVEADLPGLSELPAADLVTLGLAQADAALSRLRAFLDAPSLPTTAAVRDEAAKKPLPRAATRKAILDLHVELLVSLTAADYRLGKAYGLGRALADTCGQPRGDAAARTAALEDHLEQHRVEVIAGWLEDLKSLLPPHSAQGVADSLRRWAGWAQTTGHVEPNAPGATAAHALHRCGQQWRSLLSGEKDAADLLMTSDYVHAARGTLTQAAKIAWALARQLVIPLGAAIALVVVGIWLMVANRSTAQVLAGLGTVVGGLGITWRSAAGSAGHFSIDLIKPLWEAQLDLAVADRLTPSLQPDDGAGTSQQAGRPADWWRRAWHGLRAVIVTARRRLTPKQLPKLAWPRRPQ